MVCPITESDHNKSRHARPIDQKITQHKINIKCSIQVWLPWMSGLEDDWAHSYSPILLQRAVTIY